MQITQTKSKSGGNQTGTWSAFSAAGLSTARKNVTMVNCLFLAAFVIQMQHSGAETKQPILIDTEFTQPDKLQLRFRPLGKYAATTFTSHIRVPFSYSGLMNLESKMTQRLDQFITDIDRYKFTSTEADRRTIQSTFDIYKQNRETKRSVGKQIVSAIVRLSQFSQLTQWPVPAVVLKLCPEPCG